MAQMRTTECRACHAQIGFIKTAAGKTMPVNAESVYYIQKAGGSKKIVTPNGEVLSAEYTDDKNKATGIGYVPHWATCTNADAFHTKRKSDRKKG